MIFEFKVGDVVRDYRYKDNFVLVESGGKCYPLGGLRELTYTRDGKLHLDHDYPSLILIRRKKES